MDLLNDGRVLTRPFLFMRFFVFIIGFLGCASAQASELPDCNRLQESLRALPLSVSEFADAVSRKQIIADQCVWDGKSLLCRSVSGPGWSAADVEYRDTQAAFHDLILLNVEAKHAQWQDDFWTLDTVDFAGFHIGKALLADSCVFRDLVGDGIEIDRIDGNRTQGVSVEGLPTFAEQAGQPSAGFLPPVIRYSDLLEFAASGFFTGSLGVGANIAPGEWYGVHGLAASDNARVFEVGVNTPDLSTFDSYVVGELSLGDRVSGTAEWGHSDALRMRELDTGAFSRSDQRTRFGASVRGASHELTTSMEDYDVPGVDRFRRAKIRFGSDETLGRVLLKTDAEHESRWIEQRLAGESVSVHSALVALRAEVPLRGRGWAVAPAVDMNMSFGVVPTDDGFEASTTASVVPNLYLHTGMIGRFAGWSHRIGLSARAGVEVYGFSQREPLPPRVPDYLFDREPGGFFVGSALEQSIEAGNLRVSLPVGVMLNRRDQEPELTPWTTLSIQGSSQFVVETHALCVDGCSRLQLLTSAEIAWDELSVFGAVGDTQFGRSDSFLLGGPAAAAFSRNLEDKNFGALVGARVRLGRYYTSARVFSGEQQSGLDASMGWSPGLGWNVGLAGGLKFESNDVALTAGLSHEL